MYATNHSAVPLDEWQAGAISGCTIHVSTAAAFYATNVFEGIRIYWNEDKQEAYCLPAAGAFHTLVRVDENDALLGAILGR